MSMFDKDQFYQWGYDIFSYPSANTYYRNIPQYDGNFYSSNFHSEGDYSTQEYEESCLRGAADNLFSAPFQYYSSENGYNVDVDEADMEPSISREQSHVGDHWSSQLSSGCDASDDELGKRLYQMVPIPHVPKINGEIPSVDEATLDHQRLLERLQLYDLVECKVQGDGNCQFRALSDQIYLSPEYHESVRKEVVDQLQLDRKYYEQFVPMAFDDYLDKMSRNGEWGDHVTLQAAADSYGLKIFVITSFKDTCLIEILPKVQKSKKVIYLSFWAEVHYNSFYPRDDPKQFGIKNK